MYNAQQPKCLAVTVGFEAGSVVGHDAIDLDAVASEEAQGIQQELDGGLALLVGEDFAIGEPGVIIDGEMEILPSLAPAIALALAVAGDAMTDALDTPQPLDVDVNH